MTHRFTYIYRHSAPTLRVRWLLLFVALVTPLILPAQDNEVPFGNTEVASNATMPAIGDINKDGLQDFAVSNEVSGNISWYSNNGDGTFTENELSEVVEKARVVRIADMNGDGNPDIIAGRYQLVLYYGGGFTQSQVISNFENNVYDIHITDIDNDGDLDIFVGTIEANEIRWYQNNGDGTYTFQSIEVSSEEGIISHVTPDINNDGLPDVVCALRERDLASVIGGRTEDSQTIIYLINQGNGTFGSPNILTNELRHPESIATADFNGDGKPDILSASTDDSRVAWYANTSSGNSASFGAINTISTNLSGVKEAVAADLDGDGDQDVIAATFNGAYGSRRLVWFENNGSGTFAEEQVIDTRHIRWMDTGDMDGDGDIDILGANAYLPYDIYLYENQRAVEQNQPIVSGFSPQTTLPDSVITITGSSLGNNANSTKVSIGGEDSEVLTMNESATQLTARVPDLFPGSYEVAVTSYGETVTASESLMIQPYISALDPTELAAGESLTITGLNFRSEENNFQVAFNDEVVTDGLEINEEGTSLSLTVPTSLATGSYSVVVSANGQASNSVSLNITDAPITNPSAPVIASFTPAATSTDSVVTVTGQNLHDDELILDSVQVTLGETLAEINSINEQGTQLQFSVPDVFPGSYPITIVANGQSVTSSQQINIQPRLTNLTPDEVIQGNELVLGGDNFRSATDDIQVVFGDLVITEDIVVDSEEEIELELPESITPGNYNVAIRVNQQTSNTLPLTVLETPDEELPEPEIDSFSPIQTGVDSIVTIVGQNLNDLEGDTANMELSVGNTLAEIISVSEDGTQLQFRVPDKDPGGNTIRLTVNQQSVSADEKLLIFPYLISLSPENIPPGDSLTLIGTNFRADNDSDIQVFIGSNEVTQSSTINDAGTQVKIKLDDNISLGTYSTYVTVNKLSTDKLRFTVIEDPDTIPTVPVITTFSPTETGIDSVVTITGQYFSDTSGNNANIRVNLEDSSADVLSVNEAGTLLTFRVPDLFPGSYALSMTSNQQTTLAETPLVVKPYLTNVSPNIVNPESQITISGSNFRSEDNDIILQLDGETLDVDMFVNVAGTEARLTLPEDIQEGTSPVRIVVNGIASNELELTINDNSEPIPVDETPPVFANSNLEQMTFADSVFTFTATIEEDSSDVSQVIVRASGITESLSTVEVLDADATPFEVSLDIPTKQEDPMGMKYQIIAINSIGLTDTISYHAYRTYNLTDTSLYTVTSETVSQNSYRIIAIPYQSQAVNSTWLSDTINNYDQRFWRLFQYQGGNYQEYNQSDFTSFEPGKGYMLIRRPFNFDMQGQVATFSNETEQYFDIPITSGWNLIGNPYPFTIDWSQVVEANPSLSLPQPPKTFTDGAYTNATILQQFEGAFIRNEGEAGTLRIPLTARQTATVAAKVKAQDRKGWTMALDIQGKEFGSRISGFGMHPAAQDGDDPYDDYTVPRFTSYLDLTFDNKTQPSLAHTKDVVASKNQQAWHFSVNSGEEEFITLSWNPEAAPENGLELWLVDLQTNQIIDMREKASHTFRQTKKGAYAFSAFYGSATDMDELMIPRQVVVGSPYPNPARQRIHLPIALPEALQDPITVDIYDMEGKRVKTLREDHPEAGFYLLEWDRLTDQGSLVPSGMYFYRIQLGQSDQIHTGKILIQ